MFEQIIGWKLFRPDLNGLPGSVLATTYRVRPIGWRRLLFGSQDAGRR